MCHSYKFMPSFAGVSLSPSRYVLEREREREIRCYYIFSWPSNLLATKVARKLSLWWMGCSYIFWSHFWSFDYIVVISLFTAFWTGFDCFTPVTCSVLKIGKKKRKFSLEGMDVHKEHHVNQQCGPISKAKLIFHVLTCMLN